MAGAGPAGSRPGARPGQVVRGCGGGLQVPGLRCRRRQAGGLAEGSPGGGPECPGVRDGALQPGPCLPQRRAGGESHQGLPGMPGRLPQRCLHVPLPPRPRPRLHGHQQGRRGCQGTDHGRPRPAVADRVGLHPRQGVHQHGQEARCLEGAQRVAQGRCADPRPDFVGGGGGGAARRARRAGDAWGLPRPAQRRDRRAQGLRLGDQPVHRQGRGTRQARLQGRRRRQGPQACLGARLLPRGAAARLDPGHAAPAA